MLSVLVSFGSAIGFGIVALLGVLSGINQLNVFNVIIFPIGLEYICPSYFKNKKKRYLNLMNF